MSEMHHRPPGAALPTHFRCEGSPLDGKLIPMGWSGLTFRGKAQALVKTGLARDWDVALGLLGQHAGAIGRARKARAAQKKSAAAGESGEGPADDLKRRDRWWNRD